MRCRADFGLSQVLCNLSWLDALHELIVQANFVSQLVSLLSSQRTQVILVHTNSQSSLYAYWPQTAWICIMIYL